MNKLIVLMSCLVLFLACISTNEGLFQPIITSPDYYQVDSDYTFSIVSDDRARGRAFIANGKVYTAKHVYGEYTKHGEDTVVISETSINGLNICLFEHTVNEFIFYMNQFGDRVDGYSLNMFNGYGYAQTNRRIIPGDSGSPVFCSDHREVVGLVSAYRVINRNIFLFFELVDGSETYGDQ